MLPNSTTKPPTGHLLSEAATRCTAPPPPRRIPELLAPAGDWECARAAVENGADAIYFGLEKFNARMRADNFTVADLPRLMEYLHRRGVRGYLGFNTLVFPEELAEAEQLLRTIIGAGVDAVIVQDVGICRLIRRLSPDFPIHASTQMTITSVRGLAFARELGCGRVVLAREVPLAEIRQLAAAEPPPEAGNRPFPRLEVFVHGALCVAYSGQCLTSEALGGRSANRGVCAQACRMPYELVADGAAVELGDRRYLLSPQDLVGVEVLPELIQAGVASLKVEGRLKSPEYVANITRVYREALDQLSSKSPPQGEEDLARAAGDILARNRYDLEMSFSRGLHTGWLRGINNQQLVHGRFGTKRGVLLGEVSRVDRQEVWLRLIGPVKPGDGVVFDGGRPDLEEQGGRVYEVRQGRRPKTEGRGQRAGAAGRNQPEEWGLRFGQGDVDFSRIHVGDRVWKTSDPDLDRRLRQSFAGDIPRFRRPVEIEVHGVAGSPLRLVARDEEGRGVELESQMPLIQAEKHPLAPERLQDQLGRLGGTPFRLGSLRSHLEGRLRLPVSELNRLRREMVARLESARAGPPRWTLIDRDPTRPEPISTRPTPTPPRPASADSLPELIVLVRNLDQLAAAQACGIRTFYCDFEDPKRYRTAVGQFRARCSAQLGSVKSTPSRLPPPGPGLSNPQSASRDPESQIYVAPPRIHKVGEDWILNQVRACEPDGYLVRNYDHLEYFAGSRCVGDFSFNVANGLAAEYLLERFGLERLTVSYDLNHVELAALLRSAAPGWFEITIHHHMPMFHMEHCLFCAFLSKGADYRDCGRPCDHQRVHLRDRVGAEHPVKADLGCRNTVFNARAQTGAEHLQTFVDLGARKFRIEFLEETPEEVRRTIGKYQQVLRGDITGTQLWRELRLFNQLGVTRGPMG